MIEKQTAIALAVAQSKNGARIFVRRENGTFNVTPERITPKGSIWLGTAYAGVYRTKAAIRDKAYRKGRESAMESCGLVKVRGAVTGKVYWE